MKRWTALIIILALMLMMCSCQLEPNLGGLSSEDATAGSTNNPLVGAWAVLSKNQLFVFNADYTFYVVKTGTYDRQYNIVKFLAQGSYEITSNSEVILKGHDEHDEYMEDTSSFSLSGEKLIIDNALVLERVTPYTNFNNSIIGTWKAYDNDSFHIEISSLGGEIDSITFYDDGSYATTSNSFYGQYTIVQGGKAVQIFSPNGRNEKLYNIKFLGCGLMVFEVSDTVSAYKSYVLKCTESN